MAEETVLCAILDKAMKKRVGETMRFTLSKARVMERSGTVKILDPENNETTAEAVKRAETVDSPYRHYSRTEYRKHSNWPRVAWVQDFSKVGGAELSNLHVIKIGESLGFDIVGITPTNFNPRLIRDAQIVIVNNVFEFDEKQLHDIYWELFEHKKTFIKYDNDMRELRRLNKTRCLFERSATNIFLSPAHREAYRKEFIDGEVLPLAVDTGFWKPLAGERVPGSVIIPTYHKGAENHDRYIKDHPDCTFTVLGNRFPPTAKNIKLLNKQTPEKMRELFSSHETMVHLPAVLWAGERVYLEAMLCGCRCEVNENVGHRSWPTIDKDQIKKAPFEFWRIVESCL
jgi:hypothetical protein